MITSASGLGGILEEVWSGMGQNQIVFSARASAKRDQYTALLCHLLHRYDWPKHLPHPIASLDD